MKEIFGHLIRGAMEFIFTMISHLIASKTSKFSKVKKTETLKVSSKTEEKNLKKEV